MMADRYQKPVGCGEVRTASAFETMRFTPFTSILRVTELFANCSHSRYHCPQNTLQASQAVRRHDAQTGGFIFLRKALRDNRLKKPADHFVGCGEARTASGWEMMRFRMFIASYGLLREVHT
jgi:hypothetical protein